MRISISDTPKKRGRPATGSGPHAFIEALGDVARDQDLGGSDCLTRIVSQDLTTKGDVT